MPLQPSLLAIAAAAGRLFVAADTADAAGHTIGTVLDAANGQRLRTVAIGAGASAIAVQQPTGHVFVANEGDNSVSMLDARSGRVLRTLITTILSWLAAPSRRWLPRLPQLFPPGHAPTGSVTMFDAAP